MTWCKLFWGGGLVTHLKKEDEISVLLLQHIFVGGGYVLSLLC